MTSRSGSNLSDKEIIKAIISESSKEIDSFTRNRVNIHSFFYGLTRNDNYKDLFSDLFFDTNGPYPYSEELDEILSLLHFTGIIGSINPVLRDYKINIGEEYFKTLSGSMDKQDVQKVESLAEEFIRKLGKKSFST
jgi:hypothetical protein